MHDLRPLIEHIADTVYSHELGEAGRFQRWDRQDATESRDLGVNPYGCADAANLLYSINRFPRRPAAREGAVAWLQSLQDPATGMFNEPTHHTIHTTAHCLGALDLYDAEPLHPLSELEKYTDAEVMEQFLDQLNWSGNPWHASHQGAGLFVSLVLTGMVAGDWQDRYFNWLWNETDAETGFLRRGKIRPILSPRTTDPVPTIFPHLAGTFHYLFNIEYARRPLRFPERMVDTSLEIFEKSEFPLGDNVGFAEIDWVFILSRGLQQSGHRFAECKIALRALCDRYIPYLLGIDYDNDDDFNDLHWLFGCSCALAELQRMLPGYLRTDRPLRLVLDRRPFI